MTQRRRRDGDNDATDRAQAVGPRSGATPRGGPGESGEGQDVPRVHGAWATPAVVVRRPDGSIVNGDDPPDDAASPEDGSSTSDEGGDRAGAGPGSGTTATPGRPPAVGRTPRLRPRRIPGAPGAVLLRATLTPNADEREVRRRYRRAATASTPLPSGRGVRRRGGAQAQAAEPARTPRPSLRAVGGSSSERTGGTGRRRAARGPASRRDGRARRVIDAMAGLNFDRLLPGDEESRHRRAAQLRRISTRLAVVALVVLVIYGVFPVRTWIDQRAATDRARERLEVFQRENELLASEKRDLSTDERIEEEAREMGFVLPGEESYGIYPAPEPTPPSGTTSTTQPDG
jgi:cell division protein FtsB